MRNRLILLEDWPLIHINEFHNYFGIYWNSLLYFKKKIKKIQENFQFWKIYNWKTPNSSHWSYSVWQKKKACVNCDGGSICDICWAMHMFVIHVYRINNNLVRKVVYNFMFRQNKRSFYQFICFSWVNSRFKMSLLRIRYVIFKQNP